MHVRGFGPRLHKMFFSFRTSFGKYLKKLNSVVHFVFANAGREQVTVHFTVMRCTFARDILNDRCIRKLATNQSLHFSNSRRRPLEEFIRNGMITFCVKHEKEYKNYYLLEDDTRLILAG